MSRQIQFRRGTADQHKNFTGADGEITVDTTNKTLRVHDGVTAGGTMLARADASVAADYVTAWQSPTAENNYTWYRKYNSGWVEQGGMLASNIKFIITMQDKYYNVIFSNTSGTYENFRYYDCETTGFKCKNTANSALPQGCWRVCGFAQ